MRSTHLTAPFHSAFHRPSSAHSTAHSTAFSLHILFAHSQSTLHSTYHSLYCPFYDSFLVLAKELEDGVAFTLASILLRYNGSRMITRTGIKMYSRILVYGPLYE